MMLDKRPRCCVCDPPGLIPLKRRRRGKQGDAGRYPVEEQFEA